MSSDTARYIQRLADSPLILGQQLCGLVGWAPTLEEEVAVANIALDLLGGATALLGRSAELWGDGRSADDEAFNRTEREYSNILLVERPNGDFAVTMVRQLFYEAWALPLWSTLAEHSADEIVRGVAAKSVKETKYHLRHSAQWVVRLGDGTEESAGRVSSAVSELWPYVGEMFIDDQLDIAAAQAGVGVSLAELQPAWDDAINEVFAAARIARPDQVIPQTGGRTGLHTERLGYILAEMQAVRRAHPGATW